MFGLHKLQLENYRCFERLELVFENDVTVLFSENGGGKTAILSALAMGIAVFQPRTPKTLKLDSLRDPRRTVIGDGRQREPAGSCSISWTATIDSEKTVEWSSAVNPASGRRTVKSSEVLDAIELVRMPERRWPLFAWYGTDRTRSQKRRGKPGSDSRDRWEGYAGSLDLSITDSPLLEWLEREILGDLIRHRQGKPERRLDEAVTNAMVRATPGVVEAWYDAVERSPVVRFAAGQVAPWFELSDGFHVFLALVGDIARRAVVLNENDGRQATELIEGVVLIDEIDLHLHPRWQRVVLDGLRRAFPRLQFVVATHSPQVLSSVENRQVRRIMNGQIEKQRVYVEGRDTNAILREFMHTDDRDEEGVQALRKLHDAIDHGQQDEAQDLYRVLLARWGDLDPALIRARGLMEWEE